MLLQQFEFSQQVPRVGDLVLYEKRPSGGNGTHTYPLTWPGSKPKGRDSDERAKYGRKCTVTTLRARHKAFFGL